MNSHDLYLMDMNLNCTHNISNASESLVRISSDFPGCSTLGYVFVHIRHAPCHHLTMRSNLLSNLHILAQILKLHIFHLHVCMRMSPYVPVQPQRWNLAWFRSGSSCDFQFWPRTPWSNHSTQSSST